MYTYLISLSLSLSLCSVISILQIWNKSEKNYIEKNYIVIVISLEKERKNSFTNIIFFSLVWFVRYHIINLGHLICCWDIQVKVSTFGYFSCFANCLLKNIFHQSGFIFHRFKKDKISYEPVSLAIGWRIDWNSIAEQFENKLYEWWANLCIHSDPTLPLKQTSAK